MKTTRELWYQRLEHSEDLMAYVWGRAKAEDLSTQYLPIIRYTIGEPLTDKGYYEIVKGCCYA